MVATRIAVFVVERRQQRANARWTGFMKKAYRPMSTPQSTAHLHSQLASRTLRVRRGDRLTMARSGRPRARRESALLLAIT